MYYLDNAYVRFQFFVYRNRHFLAKSRPPQSEPQISKPVRAPHFFSKWTLHLLTTFLFKVALAHHISFKFCTCSPHFFLRLHLRTTFLFTVALGTTFLFTMQKTVPFALSCHVCHACRNFWVLPQRPQVFFLFTCFKLCGPTLPVSFRTFLLLKNRELVNSGNQTWGETAYGEKRAPIKKSQKKRHWPKLKIWALWRLLHQKILLLKFRLTRKKKLIKWTFSAWVLYITDPWHPQNLK